MVQHFLQRDCVKQHPPNLVSEFLAKETTKCQSIEEKKLRLF
jgi:hypothetical protein